MIDLPGPDKGHSLKITLQLVTALEDRQGSLYKVAERLLDQSLPLSAMIILLKEAYRHAGCTAEDEVLEDFLLQQPCGELLMDILLNILGPAERMGACLPGEALTARENGST